MSGATPSPAASLPPGDDKHAAGGDTLIPEEQHVLLKTAMPPTDGHPEWKWSDEHRLWMRREFPSLRPTGRRDVVLLGRWLLEQLGEAEKMEDPAQALLRAQQIYSTCFHELVRQVSLQCVERGQLLARVWKTFVALFDRIIKLYHQRSKAEAMKATKAVEDAQQKQSLALHELRQQKREQDVRLSHLREQLSAAQNVISVMQATVADRDAEVAHLRNMLHKLLHGELEADELELDLAPDLSTPSGLLAARLAGAGVSVSDMLSVTHAGAEAGAAAATAAASAAATAAGGDAAATAAAEALPTPTAMPPRLAKRPLPLGVTEGDAGELTPPSTPPPQQLSPLSHFKWTLRKRGSGRGSPSLSDGADSASDGDAFPASAAKPGVPSVAASSAAGSVAGGSGTDAAVSSYLTSGKKHVVSVEGIEFVVSEDMLSDSSERSSQLLLKWLQSRSAAKSSVEAAGGGSAGGDGAASSPALQLESDVAAFAAMLHWMKHGQLVGPTDSAAWMRHIGDQARFFEVADLQAHVEEKLPELEEMEAMGADGSTASARQLARAMSTADSVRVVRSAIGDAMERWNSERQSRLKRAASATIRASKQPRMRAAAEAAAAGATSMLLPPTIPEDGDYDEGDDVDEDDDDDDSDASDDSWAEWESDRVDDSFNWLSFRRGEEVVMAEMGTQTDLTVSGVTATLAKTENKKRRRTRRRSAIPAGGTPAPGTAAGSRTASSSSSSRRGSGSSTGSRSSSGSISISSSSGSGKTRVRIPASFNGVAFDGIKSKLTMPLPLRSVQRTIMQVYAGKIDADAIDDEADNPRQSAAEYVFDWFLNKYGLRKLAETHLLRMLAGLKVHRADPYVATFGRFVAMYDPLPLRALNLYLDLMCAIASSSAGHNMTPQDDPSAFSIRLSPLRAAAALHSIMGDVWPAGSEAEQRIMAAVESASQPLPSRRSIQFVDQQFFLSAVLREWQALDAEASSRLAKLFTAADVDGGGDLDAEEFTTLVRHADPSVTSAATISRLFKEGCAVGGGRMTCEAFVDACLRYGLFSYRTKGHTRADGGEAADGSAVTAGLKSGDAVKERWQSMRDDISTLLAAVSDSSKRQASQARYTRLDSLFASSDYDVETADTALKVLLAEVKALEEEGLIVDDDSAVAGSSSISVRVSAPV
eukprot:PLAT5360.1.p1 GENE.PLAT5360.1~~PLAT5360.1.p1  ORF type:complete len:1329 (+),score=498.64 PLAT5360.1:509-3988(+)